MVQSRNANARGTAARGSSPVTRAGGKISSKRGGKTGVKTGGTSKKKTKSKAAKSLRKGKKPLATMTESALQDYFGKLNGTTPGDLYDLVLSEVERPLLRTVMQYAEGNQSRAAEILGINRGTLRKKLRAYGIDVQ